MLNLTAQDFVLSPFFHPFPMLETKDRDISYVRAYLGWLKICWLSKK